MTDSWISTKERTPMGFTPVLGMWENDVIGECTYVPGTQVWTVAGVVAPPPVRWRHKGERPMFHIYAGEKHVFDAPTWKCALNLFELARTFYCINVWCADSDMNILLARKGVGRFNV